MEPLKFVVGGCEPSNLGYGSYATVGSMQFDISLIPTTTATPVIVTQGFPPQYAGFTSEVFESYIQI